MVTCTTYRDKFILWDSVVAPFVPTSVVMVTLPVIEVQLLYLSAEPSGRLATGGDDVTVTWLGDVTCSGWRRLWTVVCGVGRLLVGLLLLLVVLLLILLHVAAAPSHSENVANVRFLSHNLISNPVHSKRRPFPHDMLYAYYVCACITTMSYTNLFVATWFKMWRKRSIKTAVSNSSHPQLFLRHSYCY